MKKLEFEWVKRMKKNAHLSLSRQKFFYKTRDLSHIFLHNVWKKKHFPIYIKEKKTCVYMFCFFTFVWKGIIFNNRFCCLSFFAVSIFHYFYGVTRKKYWSWCTSRGWEFQKPKHWVWKREIRNNDKKTNEGAPSF